MNSLQNFKLNSLDITDVLNPQDVWIDVFAPDRQFKIEGVLMDGYINDDLVLDTDKLCLRYSWNLQDFVDIEVYSAGRSAWYRLTYQDFNKIKYFIHEIL